jgi:hypothetical protein
MKWSNSQLNWSNIMKRTKTLVKGARHLETTGALKKTRTLAQKTEPRRVLLTVYLMGPDPQSTRFGKSLLLWRDMCIGINSQHTPRSPLLESSSFQMSKMVPGRREKELVT